MSLGPRKDRELAERIDAAALVSKANDEHGPRFIRAWRFNDRPQTKELVSCSAGQCGCGISPDLK
jgi:hypothetical protein